MTTELESLRKENERLKKRLIGHEHNHITRDIKPRGECPSCDRHHEMQEIRELRAELERVKAILGTDRLDDWRRIQDAERELERTKQELREYQMGAESEAKAGDEARIELEHAERELELWKERAKIADAEIERLKAAGCELTAIQASDKRVAPKPP